MFGPPDNGGIDYLSMGTRLLILACLGLSLTSCTPPPKKNPPVDALRYEVPKPAEITQALEAISARLPAAAPVRVVDASTHREITDLSKPISAAEMDRGSQNEFPPLHYSM